MASIAGTTRKLSEELIETLEDKIASLKVSGKLSEAAEEEARLARLRKQYAGEAKNASLDEITETAPANADDWSTPLDRAKGSFKTDMQPVIPKDDFSPDFSIGGKTSKDVGAFSTDYSDWNKSRVGADEARGMLNKDISALPGERVEQRGNVVVRSKIPGVAAAGAGAGLYGAFGSSEAKKPEEAPFTPGAPAEEFAQQSGAPMAAGGESNSNSYSEAGGSVVAPEIKDFLGNLGNIPEAKDLTQWDADIGAIADKRQTRINQFKADVLDATAAANVASSSVEKRELIETITNAIGQIASGMYGMKHGLDLSGAKFNKTDWNAKLEMIQRNLKDSVQRLSDEQQLDQAALTEKKGDLLRNKEDLVKDYEMKFRNWQGKAELAKARQGVATDQARLDQDANKFNIEMGVKRREAAEKAAQKGAAQKDQISAGLKYTMNEQNSILQRWNSLAAEANGDKVTDEQKRAKLNEMEGLDRRYSGITGLALMPNDMDAGTPRSYADIDPEEMVEAASGRYAKRDALLKEVYTMSPNDYKVLTEPDTSLATLAQGAIASNPGMGSIAAMEYAVKEYRNTVRSILNDLKSSKGNGK